MDFHLHEDAEPVWLVPRNDPARPLSERNLPFADFAAILADGFRPADRVTYALAPAFPDYESRSFAFLPDDLAGAAFVGFRDADGRIASLGLLPAGGAPEEEWGIRLDEAPQFADDSRAVEDLIRILLLLGRRYDLALSDEAPWLPEPVVVDLRDEVAVREYLMRTADGPDEPDEDDFA